MPEVLIPGEDPVQPTSDPEAPQDGTRPIIDGPGTIPGPGVSKILADRVVTAAGRVWTRTDDGGIVITQHTTEAVCTMTPEDIAARRAVLVDRVARAQKELDWFDLRTADVTGLQEAATAEPAELLASARPGAQ